MFSVDAATAAAVDTENAVVLAGREITHLNCTVPSRCSEIKWEYFDLHLKQFETIFHTLVNIIDRFKAQFSVSDSDGACRLHIRNITTHNAGEYECKNMTGGRDLKKTSLTVIGSQNQITR